VRAPKRVKEIASSSNANSEQERERKRERGKIRSWRISFEAIRPVTNTSDSEAFVGYRAKNIIAVYCWVRKGEFLPFEGRDVRIIR
jgi:hypothetical protein